MESKALAEVDKDEVQRLASGRGPVKRGIGEGESLGGGASSPEAELGRELRNQQTCCARDLWVACGQGGRGLRL